MPEFTLDQLTKTAPSTPPGQPAGKKEFSLSELTGGKTTPASPAPDTWTREKEHAAALAGVKKVASSAADIADMVLTAPEWLVGLGLRTGTAIRSAARDLTTGGKSGKQISKDAFSRAQAIGEDYDKAMQTFPLAYPVKKVLGATGLLQKVEPNYVDHAMGALQAVIGKGGDWLEHHTDGYLPAESANLFADWIQAFAGGKIGDAALKAPKALGEWLRKEKPLPDDAMRKGEATSAEVDDLLAKYNKTEEGKKNPVDSSRGAKIVEGYIKADKDIESFNKAYDLIQRGASKREVEATLKKFPHLEIEKYMNEIMDRRRATMEGASGDMIMTQPKGPEAGLRTPQEPSDKPILPAPKPPVPRKQLGGVDRPGAEKALENIGVTTALGVLLGREQNTLKTLERLPQNRTEFTKQQVLEQMKRPDVPQAEKDVLTAALDKVEGDKISAADLLKGVQAETGNFRLTKSPTADFADYGLQNIGRLTEERAADLAEWQPEEPTEADRPNVKSADTHVWRLPDYMEMSTANHFNDPNYFGHTRVFRDTEGLRHVVEVQSDLMQKAKGGVGPEEARNLVREHDEIQDARNALEEAYVTRGKLTEPVKKAVEKFAPHHDLGVINFDKAPESIQRRILNDALHGIETRLGEISTALNATALDTQLGPMKKNWHRRLIREELADAAREGETSVRFADADTVAKVEGWPRPAEALRKRIERAYGDLTRETDPGIKEIYTMTLNQYKGQLERLGGAEFKPEHQGIYDRYKREVEKFLEQQGGRRVVDEQGHGWIEVPTRPVKEGGGRAQMFGGARDDLMMTMGGIGLGVIVGSVLADKDKFESAILGGAIGLGLTRLGEYGKALRTNTLDTLKETARAGIIIGGLAAFDKKHPVEGAMIGALLTGWRIGAPKAVVPKIGDMSIDDHINLMNGIIRERSHDATLFRMALEKAVPDPARQEALSHAIESRDMSKLNPIERKWAQAWRNYADVIGNEAVDVGVLDSMLEDYVTHIVEAESLPRSKVQEVLAALGAEEGGGKFIPGSKFAKARKYATFGELQEALKGSGLQIKTMKLGEIAEAYGKSMTRAVERKRLANTLAEATLPDDPKMKYIMPADRAPAGYKQIDTPILRGKMVHPDLAPSLKFVMESRTNNDVIRALTSLSMAQKRVSVAGSLLHASNLAFACQGATGLWGSKELTLAALNRTPMRRILRESAIDAARKRFESPELDEALRYGLRNGLNVDLPGEVDVKALEKVGAAADYVLGEAMPRLFKGRALGEKTLGSVERLQRQTFDRLTWDYLETNLKLATYLKYFEDGMRKQEVLSKEGKAALNKDQVAQQVAEAVNNFYGGLDWYRVASEAQTEWGRKMAMAALSPRGRMGLQLAMFAPDWTMSAFRSIYKALPGAHDRSLSQKLHLQYALRTGFMFFVAANGLNYALTGHSVFENQDPFMIEDGQGNAFQINKHGAEFGEWLRHPQKELINKLGYIPKEFADQLLGTEYISPYKDPGGRIVAGPAMKAGKLTHAVQGVVPFPLKDVTSKSAGDVALETLGVKKIKLKPKKEKDEDSDR